MINVFKTDVYSCYFIPLMCLVRNTVQFFGRKTLLILK